MRYQNRRTLIFIEPCLSSHLLVLKAKEKGYIPLVISANSERQSLPKEALNAAFSFFKIDTNNDLAVLDLAHKIVRKFYIHGIIPGANDYIPLAAKVATSLKKPGLTPEAALTVHRRDLLRKTLEAHGIPGPRYRRVETKEDFKKSLKSIGFPCVLKPIEGMSPVHRRKVQTLKEAEEAFESIMKESLDLKVGGSSQEGIFVEEDIPGKDYTILGFVQNMSPLLISLAEPVLFKGNHGLDGHLIRSDMDSDLMTMLELYLQKVITALALSYGPFQANVRLSEKGPLLLDITMSLGDPSMLKLIAYATGIDCYDNTLKLLSSQSLSLQKTHHLNAGIVVFNKPMCRDTLLKNPHVKEVTVLNQERSSAILLHEDYDTLKQQIDNIGKIAISLT